MIVPPQSNPTIAGLLGQAKRLLQAGRPSEAIAPLRQVTVLRPLDATLHHDLGLACLESGEAVKGIAALQQALALKPDYADAHFRLGIALEANGDSGGAIRAYDRATTLAPVLTEAWYRAGALVLTLGHRQEAIGCFRRAASSGPKTSFGRLGAARALLAEHRDGEAEQALRRMLALEPSNAMAQDLLANVLADAGRFVEARERFGRAIATAPAMAGSYYDLVRCRKMTAEDAALMPRMQAALSAPGLDVEHRSRLHLAIGKAADDFGDYALAMQHFDAADRLRQAAHHFDAATFLEQIDRMIALFTPAIVADAAIIGDPDPTPVLIVGMPRSGTTLVEQIISSHPAVAAAGELNFWNERGIAWHLGGGALDRFEFLRVAASSYVELLRVIGPAAIRVTDKMPFNFIWAGLVHLALPNATIIHCQRAAIDTGLSIHQTHFNPRVAFPTGGTELVAYFRGYHRLTAHWQRVLPPERFIQIDYQALTRDPEPVIRRMIKGCGLGWHDACLHPDRNPRSVKTPSKWQARQPIYRHAVDRWRCYERFLGPLEALRDIDQVANGEDRS